MPANLMSIVAVCGLAWSASAQNAVLTRNPGLIDVDGNLSTGDEWFTFGAASAGLDFFGFGNAGHGTLFGDNVGNAGGLFQLTIPATPGTTYEMAVHLSFESNWDATTFYGLEFYAADDATKLGETTAEVDEITDVGYLRYDLTATAPAGTAFVRPIVRFQDATGAGAGRACTVDGVFVSEADSVLNLNPGFGDPVGDGSRGDYWGVFGAAALDLDFFNNGNPGHATFFADMVGNQGGVFQRGVPASPGETYVFTADIAFETAYDATTVIGLEFYGSDDAFLLSVASSEIIEAPGAGYVTYTFAATAPASPFVTYVRPIVRFSGATGTGPERAATIDNAFVRPAGCIPVDLAEPLGTLDYFDVLGYMRLFDAGNPVTDVAAPFGTLDAMDVLNAVTLIEAGCP